ncbi:hypothetical protein [Desulfofustis glycolicus]|uniref:Uncharacterized protein n=1 Tax=Desulfofustis glycolicus DSM 9705 TaxID=1121409 RepID=A0A1M5W0Y4_9BACT|nr:hypothetical protein [Desulfofustis glycolicus]SHH81137.1 hypothetical protein SAMN02745124_02014 [Desulfofustis glycolicus DSM 9705]
MEKTSKWNNFQSTFEEFMIKCKIKQFFQIFGLVIAPFIFIRTLGFFINIGEQTYDLVLTVTVSIVLLLLLAYVIAREYLSSRKEKYANITEFHHNCLHNTRDLFTFLSEVDTKDLSEKELNRIFTVTTHGLIKVLDSLSSIFTLLTGTSCRACIKVIYEHDGKLFVRTLARDNSSYLYNALIDKKRYNNHEDQLMENIDFQMLYNKGYPGQSSFFCNNLAAREDYQSSSFGVYGKIPEKRSWYSKLTCKDWTLPYRSAIVWPIQQVESPYFHFNAAGCIGFLAVDSNSRGVFNRKWDVWIGAGIGDALFHVINLLYVISGLQLENQEKTNGKQIES